MRHGLVGLAGILALVVPGGAVAASTTSAPVVLDAGYVAAIAQQCRAAPTCSKEVCGDEKTGTLCELDDLEYAAAALAVDPGAVRRWVRQARRQVTVAGTGEGTVAPGKTMVLPGASLTGDDTGTPVEKTVIGLLTGTNVADQIAVLLSGLARFTEDRVKQESLGWGLDQVGRQVCTAESKLDVLVREELSGQTLRSFCTLAASERLAGYGAGDGTWDSLKGAVESDLRDLPGVVAGKAVTAALTTDPAKTTTLRDAFRTTFRRMVDGAEPTQSLYDLGTSIDAANVADWTAKTNNGPALQLAACAVSVPGAHASALSTLGRSSLDGGSLAVALVSAPACRTILGVTATATDGKRSESIAEAIALYEQLAGQAGSLASTWTELVEASQGAEADVKAFTDSSAALVAFLGKDDLTAAQVSEIEAKVDAQVEAGRSIVLRGLDVLDASVRLGRGTLGLIRVVKPDEIPATAYTSAEKVFQQIDGVSTLVRSVVDGDLGGALTSATPYLLEVCPADNDTECRKKVSEVAAYAGGVAAIATSETPDDAAKAINGIANPPGGWATKVNKQRVSIALTAFGGFSGGLEVRNGPNGLVYEDYVPYFAAPTLTLPIGPEFSFGEGDKAYFSIFLSALDPAAFLQYDPSDGNALPPAKVTTALAPGLRVRQSFGRSPFGVSLGGVWRPGLRTPSTDPFGPGADALQVTLGLDVDVTLFSLYRSSVSEKGAK